MSLSPSELKQIQRDPEIVLEDATLQKKWAKSLDFNYINTNQVQTFFTEYYDAQNDLFIKDRNQKQLIIQQMKENKILFYKSYNETTDKILLLTHPSEKLNTLLSQMDYNKVFVIHKDIYDKGIGISSTQLISKDEIEHLMNDKNSTGAKAEPVVKRILHFMVINKHSDLKIIPKGNDFYQILYRDADTMVYEIMNDRIPKDFIKPIFAYIKNNSNMSTGEQIVKQLNKLKIDLAEDGVRQFRVSFSAGDIKGESCVLRTLYKYDKYTKELLTYKGLGFTNQRALKVLNQIATSRNGLFIVTGKTGSGKTWTYYAIAIAKTIYKQSIHLIENPSEMELTEHFNRVVQKDLSDFANVIDEKLKPTEHKMVEAVMTENPDCVTISESRESIIMKLVWELALRDTQVFTTYHSNSLIAFLAILLSKNYNIPENIIKQQLKGFVWQSLEPKLCQKCLGTTQIIKPNTNELIKCQHCNAKGYKGRELIYEVTDFHKNKEIPATDDLIQNIMSFTQNHIPREEIVIDKVLDLAVDEKTIEVYIEDSPAKEKLLKFIKLNQTLVHQTDQDQIQALKNQIQALKNQIQTNKFNYLDELNVFYKK